MHPLYSSHLIRAHTYWKEVIQDGHTVIDATCGNGHDTLFLAKTILENSLTGSIIGLDIQEQALESTRALLEKNLSPPQLDRVNLYRQSHATFPQKAYTQPIMLIVYNLGYLPGGNKQITTQTETTLISLQEALVLLAPGGTVSITCYPGHPEGFKEELTLLSWLQTLSHHDYSICHHRWINKIHAPSLLLIKKIAN